MAVEFVTKFDSGVTPMADSGFVKVAQVSEIKPGEMTMVNLGDDQVLLANVNGNIHACEDICSHAYASLSEGDLNGEEVECPLHGGVFSVVTGEALGPPADDPVKLYKVQIDGDDVLIASPEE
jgi:nitrite reductase/ring-hydroxylating ferredoxin subunit